MNKTMHIFLQQEWYDDKACKNMTLLLIQEIKGSCEELITHPCCRYCQNEIHMSGLINILWIKNLLFVFECKFYTHVRDFQLDGIVLIAVSVPIF